jgi:hypothetical protein
MARGLSVDYVDLVWIIHHNKNNRKSNASINMPEASNISCQCECGQTQVSVAKPPMLRFHCHCTICQNLYKRAFSDVTVMWAKNAKLTQGQSIEYRRPGLLLKRGVCTQCEEPILAYMTLFPGVKLAFVPGNRYQDAAVLPEPSAHIFYHRSETPMDDGIAKYKGFIKSELVITWLILKSAVSQFLAK